MRKKKERRYRRDRQFSPSIKTTFSHFDSKKSCDENKKKCTTNRFFIRIYHAIVKMIEWIAFCRCCRMSICRTLNFFFFSSVALHVIFFFFFISVCRSFVRISFIFIHSELRFASYSIHIEWHFVFTFYIFDGYNKWFSFWNCFFFIIWRSKK